MDLTQLQEKHKKHKIIPILIAIFLLGFAIRYLTKGPRIGPELDTWFHYRMVNYILDTGSIPKIDPMAYYPTGRPVLEMDILGLPFFIAYTYKIVGITGITLMDYMVMLPAITTSLAAIPLYYLTKELIDERSALLTALFWQIIPSTLTRTHAGFVDKESLSSLFIFLWLWLMLKSIHQVKPYDKKTFVIPIISGFFMGLSSWTWGGTDFFILVIGTSLFLYILFNIKNIKETLTFTFPIMTFVGFLTMYIVQKEIFPIQLFFSRFVLSTLSLPSLILITLLIYRSGGKSAYENNKNLFLILTAGFVGILIYLKVPGKLLPQIITLVNFFKTKLFLEKNIVGQTVSENLSPALFGGGSSIIERLKNGEWYSHFDVTLFVAPLGLLLLINKLRKERDFGNLFLFILVFSGIVGMRSDVRLGFVLTPGFAILTSMVVFYFIQYMVDKKQELGNLISKSNKQKVKYKAETSLSNVKIELFLIYIIMIGIIAAPTISGFSMLNGRKVDVPTPWYNAMIWIKDNTPEDAVIVSWWDYGYWIQALGQRKTVVDGGNTGPLVYDINLTQDLDYQGSSQHRNVDIARFFTSNEQEGMKFLRPYVDFEKTPTYVIVSYEEFGKSGAINHISQGGNLFIFPRNFPNSGDIEKDSQRINDFINQNGIEAYAVINLGSVWQVWFTGLNPNTGQPDPEMKNKLLAKLLPFQNTGFGQGLENFELVYKDDWNYVLIYKIV